ncbi:hypothetical protein IKG64_00125 [Candidatus Saccharibacteria bacterium]|nr:hypothetical protein [Candidatus Saccharibacteria bacterium]
MKKSGKRGEHRLVESRQGVNYDDIKLFGGVDFGALDSMAIEFSAEAAPEVDEYYYIDLDEQHSGMMDDYIQNASSTAGVSLAGPDDFSKAEVLYVARGDGGGVKSITFQKILPSVKISSGFSLFLFDGRPEIKKLDRSISIVNRIDAIYDVERKRIYFREFSKIRCMFDGIVDYYRSATDDEVRRVKECGYLDINEDVKVGVRSRKIIASMLDDRILEDPEYSSKLGRIFDKYGEELELKMVDGKIVVGNDKELTKALSVMIGRCFTNEITGEKTLAIRAERFAPISHGGDVPSVA